MLLLPTGLRDDRRGKPYVKLTFKRKRHNCLLETGIHEDHNVDDDENERNKSFTKENSGNTRKRKKARIFRSFCFK